MFYANFHKNIYSKKVVNFIFIICNLITVIIFSLIYLSIDKEQNPT